jgi:hypothetical protein
VSYCRLVPGAGNSGGKTRHKRTKDGSRYLKLAFGAVQPRGRARDPVLPRDRGVLPRDGAPEAAGGRAGARALVAKELARVVYYVPTQQEAFNGTFKGKPLSRTKQPKWPRLASPPA